MMAGYRCCSCLVALCLRGVVVRLQTLANVASLLGVDEKALEDMLTLKVCMCVGCTSWLSFASR